MGMLLTHQSALEVMRRPDFVGLVEEWGSRTNMVPDKLPPHEDLVRALEGDPVVASLSTPLHLLVSNDSNSHSSRLVTRHVSGAEYPRGAFVRVGEGVLVSSPELVGFQMARQCALNELALLLSELLGTYAIDPAEGRGMRLRDSPLTTREDLTEFLRRMGHGYGTRKMRDALPLASQDSASPMESKLALRVRAPREMGGYQTPFVSMNEEIALRPLCERLDALRVRKPDIVFLNPARPLPGTPRAFVGVSLDYHGDDHRTPEREWEDGVRRIELLAAGIKSFEIFKCHYDDIDVMDALMQAIARDAALPELDLSYGREARMALHDELERYDCVSWSGSRRPRTYDLITSP